MRRIAFILWGMLLSGACVEAQEAPTDIDLLPITAQPLPSGALINPAPAFSQWTVTVTSLPANPAKAQLRSAKSSNLTIIKSDKIYKVVSVGSDGYQMVRWSENTLQATYVSGAANPFISDNANSIDYIDFSQSDYPEFLWISAKKYVGVTKLPTGLAMVFKASIHPDNAKMPELTGYFGGYLDVAALIDLQTRRPLLLQVNNQALAFQFTASPPGALSLPPQVEQAFAALLQRIHRASLMPPG